MIKEFIKRFNERKKFIEKKFGEKHPENYLELVKIVIETIANKEEYGGEPDIERIHEIDDGAYQGTLIFIIAEQGYQPDKYWYVKVRYGSCSGCDTLQGIEYNDENYGDIPTKEQIKDYMILALHIVQNLHEMKEEE